MEQNARDELPHIVGEHHTDRLTRVVGVAEKMQQLGNARRRPGGPGRETVPVGIPLGIARGLGRQIVDRGRLAQQVAYRPQQEVGDERLTCQVGVDPAKVASGVETFDPDAKWTDVEATPSS